MMMQNKWIDMSSRRAILHVSGSDTDSFLQGMITQDITKLTSEYALVGVMLSPQGKFLFDFFMLRLNNKSIWLETEADRVDELCKKLTMYKLRSDVNIEVLSNLEVAVMLSNTQKTNSVSTVVWQDDVIIYTDPRKAEMGQRIIGSASNLAALKENLQVEEVAEELYDHQRIQLCLPEGSRDAIINKTILLESRYDELNGVSFTKGCYVGQEVTARSHYRGNIRKRLRVVESNNGDDLPQSGTIIAGEMPIGELRSVSGNIALALIRHDRLEKKYGEDLVIGRQVLKLVGTYEKPSQI